MSDLDRMLEAMKQEPWSTWLATADAMEEAGDKRADGLRMLAKYKLYPDVEVNRRKWVWDNRGDNFLRYPKNGAGRWRLPAQVFMQLTFLKPALSTDRHMRHIYFPTADEAILLAAEAWSRVLQARDLDKGLSKALAAEKMAMRS